MKPEKNDVLINFAQVVEQFDLTPRVVRAWVEKKRLVPVRRSGSGRGGGKMWFTRGEVGALIYGLCPVCGSGFKRSTLRQVYCRPICRKKFNNLKGKE